MRMGCCTLSLLLDTGNFKKAYIDEKQVQELYFNGDKIYDAAKWIAVGLQSGTNPTTIWAPYSTKTAIASTSTELKTQYIKYVVGGKKTSNSTMTGAIYYFDANNKNFLSKIAVARSLCGWWSMFLKLREYILENKLTPIDAKLFSYFRQDSVNEDIEVYPYIISNGFSYSNASASCHIHPGSNMDVKYSLGRPNGSTSCNEGPHWTYTSDKKGKGANSIVDLNEGDVKKAIGWINDETTVPGYVEGKLPTDLGFSPCEQFKLTSTTTDKNITAYGAVWLLFKVV